MVREGKMPFLGVVEHNEFARAKRAELKCLLDDGSGYITPSAFDYTDSDPIAVVLVHPGTGASYSAIESGGTIAGSVTAYVAGSVPLTISSMPNVAGSVTAYVAGSVPLTISSMPNVAGSVTAYVADSVPLTISSMPNVAGSVTAYQGGVSTSATVGLGAVSFPAKYSDIRTRTIYVPTEAGASRQINILTPGPWGWVATADQSNGEAIYIGPGSSVVSTPEDANSGWALHPGQSIVLPLDNMTVYAVCPTITGILNLITVIV